MMLNSHLFDLCSCCRLVITLLLLLLIQSKALNTDGLLLLSFKYNVLSDPLGVLDSWNYNDATPCSWYGVSCGSPTMADVHFRVYGLSLPNSQLTGSVPANLGMIQHFRNLDLSNNSINGSIPLSIFNATELRTLDLSNNFITGNLPELVGGLNYLELLNLSDNALSGKIPEEISTLHNLKALSLKNNYFSGSVPSGFDSVQVVDLSSNLMDGSLSENFGGNSLKYLNMSYNRLSGAIPQEFANTIPSDAIVDLSFNNFSGEIPEATAFQKQNTSSFSGNFQLCGKPLKTMCPILSTMSTLPPNATAPTSPPAIAAIPKTIDSTQDENRSSSSSIKSSKGRINGLPLGTIIAIVVGDVMGVLLVALIFIYIYQRKKSIKSSMRKEAQGAKDFNWASSSSFEEYKWIRSWTCLRKQKNDAGNEEESSSSSSETAYLDGGKEIQNGQKDQEQKEQKRGELVTVDGERKLELETLLKASAYILGASGSSIMYKAVMEDGTALAVRRIGEGGLERFRDFENQVRAIAKLFHQNLVRIRGFYWGSNEKLVIYDFVPNGSLANARYRKVGTSPSPFPWQLRLKIAKGVARGLTYIHEKKHVHGNLKPSNILLGANMEPKIGDFGLERFVTGETSYKAGGSARIFGSKRSTASRDGEHDIHTGSTPSPSPSSLIISPYYAPESLRSLKPNPKWDVYSFGVVLLELLTGKIFSSDELAPDSIFGNAMSSVEEKSRVLRMADAAIRADLEGKEDEFLVLLKLGYNCICPVPQKRPNMKEVLHALEKFPFFSSTY